MTIPDLERADQIAKGALASYRKNITEIQQSAMTASKKLEESFAVLKALQDYAAKCSDQLVRAKKQAAKQSQ